MLPETQFDDDFHPDRHGPDPGGTIKDTELPAQSGTRELFNEEYYSCSCGVPYDRTAHWLNFFGTIADHIIRSLRPRKVLDVGCAMGLLVEALWDRGIEAYGIDISSYAISKVRRDMVPYCRIASITDPITEHFDLVTCIEVLEHIPPEQTSRALESLCQCTDTILFSSSPTDLVETTHFNVRPTISWLRLFASLGFWPDVLFDAGFITPHAMLLRRARVPEDLLLTLFSEFLRCKMALASAMSSEALHQAALREFTIQLDALRLQNAQLSGDGGVIERLRSDLAALQSDRDANEQRISELRQEMAGLHGKNLGLSQNARQAEFQLRNILDSPGWKLIRKYRTWLQRQQNLHPRFFTSYEGIAARLLTRYTASDRTKARSNVEKKEPIESQETRDLGLHRIPE
jgi:SAM-dependent methyltransferase